MADAFGVTPQPARAPFSVGPTLHQIDDQLNMMIARTTSTRERILGARPENGSVQSTHIGPGSLQTVAEGIEDKLRALNNLIADIDNAI